MIFRCHTTKVMSKKTKNIMTFNVKPGNLMQNIKISIEKIYRKNLILDSYSVIVSNIRYSIWNENIIEPYVE